MPKNIERTIENVDILKSLLNSPATKINEQANATKRALKFNTAVSFFEYCPVPNALQNKDFPVANRVDKASIRYSFT
ncbi:MAG: hypothetical protein IJA82_03180 [Clostridia bacterium]|nr:hypothetical protein [Clostridia bacterium]